MRNQQPIRTARRKARQQERESKGVAVSPCVLCIEEHHTAGKNHDAQLTAPVCEMHHHRIHEQLLRSEISLRYEANPTRRIAAALRSSAVYDRAQADAKERWATSLEDTQKRHYRK